ncbi:hypothetical protein M3J09_010222 [Ascochyta lentis]
MTSRGSEVRVSSNVIVMDGVLILGCAVLLLFREHVGSSYAVRSYWVCNTMLRAKNTSKALMR